MVSVLRQLQEQWNALVPQAQAAGIPRVRMLNNPLETIQYRRDKLNWLRAQLMGATSSNPVMPDRSFGVEIECFLPREGSRDGLINAIRGTGIQIEFQNYNHNVSSKWKITTDGSLGDYTRGIEAVSPILHGEPGLEQVTKVVDALKSFGCRVSKKCGLHVHVGGIQNETIDFFKSLIMLYANAEIAIDSFMPPSRRGSNNTFIRSLAYNVNATQLNDARTITQVATSIGQSSTSPRSTGRYSKLNLQSFWQHGTVEFRHHQGTVESLKVRHWINLCLRMCQAAHHGRTLASTVDQLMDTVQATDTERRYFRGRVSRFNRAIPRSNAFAETGERQVEASRRPRTTVMEF